MRTVRNFAVLAMVCFAISACGTVMKSSEMKVLEAESSLFVYNGVTQGVNKDGQVGVQLTLIGQAKAPSQTVTTQQVPVTVTTQAAAPQRPVYSRDTRAAKAVPRTPPASPPVTKTEMQTVVTTTTTFRGPEVLASTGGGGPSTGHSVAAAIPGALAGVGSAAVGGAFFQAGMKALRPAQTNVTQTGGGATATGGAGGGGGSSSSSSAAAAAASAAAAAAAGP